MNPSVSSSPRLKPVAENIYHDGASFALLSPNKGLRNASVIYNSIRNMPAKTLVRGDFTKNSVPFIYFPERPQRKIIGAHPKPTGIEKKNIETGRKELAEFIHSINIAAIPLSESDHQIAVAKMHLNFIIYEVEEMQRDFKVGDIKEPLSKIAKAYAFENVRKLTSPHRLLPQQGTVIQDKRLREFAHMTREMFSRLADAIRPDTGINSEYDTDPEIAIYNTKELFKEYLKLKPNSKKSFADFIRNNGVSPFVAYLAKRWIEISMPIPSHERKLLATEAWAKELDRVCPLLIKQQRRGARIVPSVDKNNDIEQKIQYRQPSTNNLPPLPLIKEPSSAFVAYSRFDEHSETASGLVDNNNQPQPQHKSQVQTQFSPLSPDTPDVELVSRRPIFPSGSLPKFDLNIPYSSIDSRTFSQLSFGIAREPQTVPGQLIAASAQELPAVATEKSPSSPEKKRVTAHVVHSNVKLIDSNLDTGDDFSGYSSEDAEDVLPAERLPKFPVFPPTAISSVALPTVDSQRLLSPERPRSVLFTSPSQTDDTNNVVSDISSTIEDQ